MSSSRTDAAAPPPRRVAARGEEGGASLIKQLLPRSLFGRSLLIIVTPLVLAQAIATWVFYDRHWDTVARRLSGAVAGEIAFAMDAMRLAPGESQRLALFDRLSSTTELDLTFSPGETLPPGPARGTGSSLETQLAAALDERVAKPHRLTAAPDPRDILIRIQLDDGILDVAAPRKRLYSSTTYIFVLWMVGSSLILLGIAVVFMRNQVRSLRRLAAAADSFGKGHAVPDFKLEGATEIRQAGLAFLAMRDRIQRQITQRTEMLAGVSHDLRTPLTRMKLALALIGENETVDELRSDVEEMQRMVQGYLDFARGEGSEAPVETDLQLLLDEVAAVVRRDGVRVFLTVPEDCVLPLRPHAMKRCLGNLVGNAARHGRHVWIGAMMREGAVEIMIDDDGPGIPAEHRQDVFRPFFRLDPSRNPATGGVGLGLTIARDVARGHGGDLTLETSPQGGLRARIHLPR